MNETRAEGLEIGICGFPLGDFLKDQIGTVSSSFTFGTVSSISPYEGVPIEGLEAFQLDATATHGNSGGPVFNKDNQKVIGLLQGGIMHTSGSIQPGLVRCEPPFKFVYSVNVEEFKKTKPGENPDPRRIRL